MKAEQVIDFGVNDWRDAIEAWVGKIVAIVGGIWAVWKGTKFATQRIRQVWRTLNAFADSVDALRSLTVRMENIEAEQRVNFFLSEYPRWIADEKGNYLAANPPCLRLMGMSESEIIGAGWAAALHPDDAADVMAAWNSAVKGQASFRKKFRLRNLTETIQVEARAVPVRADGGLHFIGATAVINRKPITQDRGQ